MTRQSLYHSKRHSPLTQCSYESSAIKNYQADLYSEVTTTKTPKKLSEEGR
jgi:hypothetical protein